MTTPPDAYGADDNHAQDPGGAPEPAWQPPAPPGTGAVQFSDDRGAMPHTGAPTSGAVPFADPSGAAAAPFSDYPALDAAPHPGTPGTGGAPFAPPSWPEVGPHGAVPPGPAGPGVPAWPAPQPPGGPQPPSDPQPPSKLRRTSKFALIALITGLFGLLPVAIGFGIAALIGRRSRIRKGKSFAIAGIAAAIAWGVAVNLLAPTVVDSVIGSVFSPERDASGKISASGKALFSTLRKGDCFTGYDITERFRLVEAVPCSEPHTGEVIARSTLPDGSFPGDERAELAAHVVCGGEAKRLRKSPMYPKLRPYYMWPTATSWRTGYREVVCAMHHGGGALESRLAETVDTDRRTYEELERGDCIKTWDRTNHPLMSLVPCSKPHFAEVIATYEIEPELKHDPGSYPAYPSVKTLEDDSLRECEKLIVGAFSQRPKPGIAPFVLLPNQFDWESGIRTVICGLTLPGQDLVGRLPRG